MKNSNKPSLKKNLLICGILSSLLYVAMNIFVPLQFPGYNSASQTVSELSAIGAPSRMLWVVCGGAYTLLVLAFGWGVRKSAAANGHLRIAGSLIIIYAALGILWPLGPMHQREVLAVNGGTVSDTMHIVLAAITSLLMLLAMGFGAAAFGKQFRVYSIVTILLLLIFGATTGAEAPRVQANLPTPLLGIYERVMIGVFLLWIVVLAIVLSAKHENRSQSRSSLFDENIRKTNDEMAAAIGSN